MVEDELVEELSKKYNRKEKEIKILIEILKRIQYNIDNKKNILEEFFNEQMKK